MKIYFWKKNATKDWLSLLITQSFNKYSVEVNARMSNYIIPFYVHMTTYLADICYQKGTPAIETYHSPNANHPIPGAAYMHNRTASLVSPWLLWWPPAESHNNIYDHSAFGYASYVHCALLLYSVRSEITTTARNSVHHKLAHAV